MAANQLNCSLPESAIQSGNHIPKYKATQFCGLRQRINGGQTSANVPRILKNSYKIVKPSSAWTTPKRGLTSTSNGQSTSIQVMVPAKGVKLRTTDIPPKKTVRLAPPKENATFPTSEEYSLFDLDSVTTNLLMYCDAVLQQQEERKIATNDPWEDCIVLDDDETDEPPTLEMMPSDVAPSTSSSIRECSSNRLVYF